MKEGELYLSKYKILKVFKETLEGCVLLAEHIQLNSYWIIKKLNGVNVESMREVEVLKGVKHPGIPMIIDVILEDDSLVIIREYVEGENLNDYSKSGLSQDEILDIGLKLCEILKFLHEELTQPLIFRDLKPGNIIMTCDGDLKIIDFGIARFYKEESSHDTTYLGTKGFASPEQYGFDQSDVRTDVFGLGATLYFLTTQQDLGKPPYSVLPICKFRKDIESNFEKILIRACEINKNKRFQSIHDFEIELKKLVRTADELTWEQKINVVDRIKVGVSGLRHGVGTTYTAMRLAKFLVGHHMKVCVVDASKDENLMSLEFQDNTEVRKGSICYQGIEILAKSQVIKDSFNTVNKRLEDVHIIIIDFGLYEPNNYTLFESSFETKKSLTPVIVSKISPWEIEFFEELVFSELSGCHQHIVVNSCSPHRFHQVKKSLEDLAICHLPYEPYEVISLDDDFSKQLLKEMEVDMKWPKKANFLSPSYYKTKLFDRIK